MQLVVRFRSSDVGAFAERLAFECVGGPRVETLELKGACDYPKISDDYRNVYYRKTKQRPAEKDVNHQFIVSRDPDVPGTFEFGPLLNNRERPEAPPPWEEGQVDEHGEPVPEPADPPRRTRTIPRPTSRSFASQTTVSSTAT